MATLYDKSGNKYDVPHAVDVKGWLATGNFFEEKQKGRGRPKVEQVEEETISSELANKLVKNLNSISADEVKALAKYLKMDYSTKDETLQAIKEKIGK